MPELSFLDTPLGSQRLAIITLNGYVFRKLRVIVKGMNILASQATLSKPLGTKVYSKRMEFANRSLLQKNGICKQKSTPKERNLQTEVYSKRTEFANRSLLQKNGFCKQKSTPKDRNLLARVHILFL